MGYQSLGSRRALSYTALMRGETDADVPVQNYGAEVRFASRCSAAGCSSSC
jgi:hypothetical protein